MEPAAITSAAYLRGRQYADDRSLRARQAVWRHRRGPDLVTTTLAALELTGRETVVDVGCGNGRYLAELRSRGHTGRLVGVDLSFGMAATATANGYGGADRATVMVGDVCRMPLRDGVADAALAMHMLYHSPDLPAALSELRRVLRPGGRLIASTNGDRHAIELVSVMNAAARATTGHDRRMIGLPFALSNARDLVGKHFNEVTVTAAAYTGHVSDAAMVIGYVASFGPEWVGLSETQSWDTFLGHVTALVERQIDATGAFPVTSHTGYVLAR